jgi:tellurite resistance protein
VNPSLRSPVRYNNCKFDRLRKRKETNNMDLNSYFDEFEKMSKEQIGEEALALCPKLSARFTKIAKLMGRQPDEFEDNLFRSALCIFAADGRIDQAEFDLLSKIGKATNQPAHTIEEVRGKLFKMATMPQFLQLVGLNYKMLVTTDPTDDTPQAPNFVKFLCAVAAYNGSVDSSEISIINNITGDTGAEAEADDSSSSTEEESSGEFEQRKPLVVVKKGATVCKDGDYYYVSVGAIISNPNKATAGGVRIKTTFFDAQGGVIDTNNDDGRFIDPNSYFYFGREITIRDGVPAKYTIGVGADDFYEEANINNGSFVGSGWRLVSTGHGSRLSGIITSHYPEKVDEICFSFTFLDDAGNVVGGVDQDVENLFPETENPFSVELENDLSGKATKVHLGVRNFYTFG